MNISVPVTPYVATYSKVDHVVLSLLGLAPPEHLTLPVVPPANPQLTDLSLEIQQMDLQMMAGLGFSGAVTFASKISAQTFFFLSDLTSSVTISNNDAASIIADATFSVGIRIGIFAFNLDTSITFNAYTIAAQATLNKASTAFQVIILGAGLDAVAVLKPLITSSIGPFTVETLQSIGAIQSEIATLFASQPDKLIPILASVSIDTSKLAQVVSDSKGQNLTDVIAGNSFAMERALRNVVADDAVAKAVDHGVNPDIVKLAYKDILNLSGRQAISQDNRQTALSGLEAGRF